MTRWLLIVMLLSGPMPAFGQTHDGFKNVPKCKGVETGHVTILIMPNGTLIYYLADRPMPQVTGANNLTCSFESGRTVKLLDET